MMLKPLILVADDDPDDQFMIHEAFAETFLTRLEVCFVSDGMELLEALRKCVEDHAQMPHLIILDMHMPRKDGRTTLKELREDPLFANLPVAILTNYVDTKDLSYCSEYGTVGYFRKPNTITELKVIITTLCSQFVEPNETT